jgi:succinate dehydrogenase / fumarate reductase, membrane anchor subunit
MSVQPRPIDEPGGGAGAFLGQIVSGVALLILLTLHMIAQHFILPEGLRDYASVIEWVANPIVVLLELSFLAFVTWHALLGLRAIIFDYGFSVSTERWITRAFVVIGVVTVVYGTWLMVAIVSAA